MPAKAMSENTFADIFEKYFYVIRADTPQLKLLAYRIRYDVYCREFQYEEPNPEHIETDHFDDHSMHCLLIHKPTGTAAGCVRLIDSRKLVDKHLPFEPFFKNYGNSRYFRLIDPNTLRRGNYGEISRLAVRSSFRRRKIEKHAPISYPITSEAHDLGRNSTLVMPISLVLAAFVLQFSCGFDYGFAMMEMRLVRLLNRYGIRFMQVGDLVNYHGRRGPFCIHEDLMRRHFKPEIRELMAVMKEQLSAKPYHAPVQALPFRLQSDFYPHRMRRHQV